MKNHIIIAIIIVLAIGGYFVYQNISKTSTLEIQFDVQTQANEINCAKKGEHINHPAGTNRNLQDICCKELKGLSTFGVNENGECELLVKDSPFPSLTCPPCGNNICDEWENGCNCPEDCECAKEGEPANPPNLRGKTSEPDVCCVGLTGVGGYRVNSNGECEVLIGSPYLWCVPCGNGVCDKFESIEENKCNCPEDCQIE